MAEPSTIDVLGGGPSGLYAAMLFKKAMPDARCPMPVSGFWNRMRAMRRSASTSFKYRRLVEYAGVLPKPGTGKVDRQALVKKG